MTVGAHGNAALLIYDDAVQLSSPCFSTSPYLERAWCHVIAAQSRDLASPIYGYVEALTGTPDHVISLAWNRTPLFVMGVTCTQLQVTLFTDSLSVLGLLIVI